jgi:hypothetical protein
LANIAFARSLWPWAATAAASFENPFEHTKAFEILRCDAGALSVVHVEIASE